MLAAIFRERRKPANRKGLITCFLLPDNADVKVGPIFCVGANHLGEVPEAYVIVLQFLIEEKLASREQLQESKQ